jgi:uncharacterized protein YbcI
MPDTHQSTVQTIADQISALYKSTYGRGPRSVTVHITHNAVSCILQDVNTPAQDSLVRFGSVDVAQLAHHRLQVGMADAMSAAVESATGRKVRVYIPGFNAEAAATTDVFLLEPEAG